MIRMTTTAPTPMYMHRGYPRVGGSTALLGQRVEPVGPVAAPHLAGRRAVIRNGGGSDAI